MIRSFGSRETARLFVRERSPRLPEAVQRPALRKLRMIHHARSLADLRVPPGNRLEPLHGDRQGQHSIRINQHWRICFRWDRGDAYEVEIVDYH